LYHSEKKSLGRFLIIYLSSTMTLFIIAMSIFYSSERHNLLDSQKESIKKESINMIHKLRELHQENSNIVIYPKNLSYQSAIFNVDKKEMFSTFNYPIFNFNREFFIQNQKLFFLTKVEPYYIGSAYLLLQRDINYDSIDSLKKKMLIFIVLVFVFLCFLGFFLGRLFIAPMKKSISLLNSFIEDTTHELNTPISTILANIELIEMFGYCENREEMNRIEIASKSLSHIYNDLTYLKLNHKYNRVIIEVNISILLKERVDYFSTKIESKNLSLNLNIMDNIIWKIDINDAIRVIDNLLSNAIKYNKNSGELNIELSKDKLIISDDGVGIETKDLKNIFKRFKRANNSEGGFGIGLNIVYQIIKDYKLDIEIKSKIDIGTTVIIKYKF